jgi:hypothetical protein
MTAPLHDAVVAPVAADLLACLVVEMNKTTTPPASICLRSGTQVTAQLSETVDECCLGLAWVRFVRQYASGQSNFPDPDGMVSPCGVLRWALVFELGAARCAPMAPESTVPTCAEHVDAALVLFDDLAAIRRALCCYATANKPDRLVFVSDAVPGDAEGGCQSVSMQVTISARACDPVCVGSAP